MESKAKNNSQKKNLDIKKVLRRPIVRMAILIILIIAFVIIIKSCVPSKSNDKNTKIEGYQKLINVKDNKYTYINQNGKVKKYDGYSSMNDFYYDVTCASKIDKDTGVYEAGLINKNNGKVVKFGVYDNLTQVVGGKYYKAEKDGKYGVIDYKGKEIIAPEYTFISVTPVQESTEIVFECQKDGKYYFVNEQGKNFYETDAALHSISYANKFNSDYDTIIYISVDGNTKYFNLKTGDEIFKDIENVNISYNILNSNGKISFYDKNAKLKKELDITEEYSANAKVFFKKYVVFEQKNISGEDGKNKYTVYDDNFKKLIEEENVIVPVQDVDGNIYFIINEAECVKIISESKKVVKVKGYEYNGGNASALQYLVLNPIEDKTICDIYTFKGKKVAENISETSQKEYALVVKGQNDEGEVYKSIMLGKNSKVNLEDNDEIIVNDYYITIENSKNEVISVVDKEGNIKLDKVAGRKLFFVENYIGISIGDVVNIYSTKTGKQTFSYDQSNYVDRDENVNVVELKDGYYTFSGKKIIEK